MDQQERIVASELVDQLETLDPEPGAVLVGAAPIHLHEKKLDSFTPPVARGIRPRQSNLSDTVPMTVR
jgi:hypothetical protein